MPKEIAQQIWSDLLREGTPHEIIDFIWSRIADNGTLSAFFLMLWTLTLRFLLMSFYFSLTYLGIAYIKKHLHKKLNVLANYCCWYFLLCSFALANLWFNNVFMVLPTHLLRTWDSQTYKPYAFLLLSLFSAVWLLVTIFKLMALARMNGKIKKSMRHMKCFNDNEDLADQAVLALGLRRKPNILIADYIDTPVSYGGFKKTILLPVDYEDKYSSSELYLLLLHEMAHIKNGDTAKLYIVSFTSCFLWLTPVTRLFIKNFKRDSEILCDNRVMGLQSSKKDTYGSLILKECKCKNAPLGFGFSDSYYAIANRLDALYRYKDMADGRLKLFAIIPVILLMICTLSYALRADWLTVNDKYNSEFEIGVFDADTGEYVPLPPEVCTKLCEIEDGMISINPSAMRALTQSYAKDGRISYRTISDNYIVQMGETVLSSGFDSYTSFPAEEQELIIISSDYLKQRTLAEYLFLLITSKL